MEVLITVLVFAVGLAIGGFVVKRMLNERTTEMQAAADERLATEQASLSRVIDERAQRITQLEAELVQQRQQDEQQKQQQNEALLQERENRARLETQLQAERHQNEEKLKLLEDARTRLGQEFENLATKILDEKSKKFTDQNKDNISQILTPLREQLGEFRRKVEDAYEKESKDRVSLFHEIKHLKDLNQQISEDALNLTKALKGQNVAQGAWGEVILERVLEESGLHKGREYDTQESFTSDDGKRYRPDAIVHLPEGKDIIVDSKVTLTAYERYCSADDELERSKALKEHISAMRAHIKGLSAKNYEDLPEVSTLDFVLMFIPIEAAFITAVEHDRDIFRDAFEKNIIVVSPSTLLATLKTVHNIWRYEYQNQNAQEIAEKAGGLYDQFVLFVTALDDVGDKLGKAQQAYDTARNRLSDGRGNLVRRTEQLKKLGARAKKSLPDNLVALSQDESE